MRSFFTRGALPALLLVGLTSAAFGQDAPTLFPLPPLPTVASPNVKPAVATDALWGQVEPSPAPIAPNQPIGQGVMSPSYDYVDAMKGGYEGGCSAIGGPCGSAGCCHNHYVYANALLMTGLKQGGFVPGVNSANGNAALFFCQPEFGRLWHGGFEIGTGWCFGCNCNSALEMVYWGVFPSTGVATARGSLNSTIDFGDLNYNGVNVNTLFTNSLVQQVQFGWNFNSVEANIVSNSWNGGPFGCGMCGFCNGRGGSPWGFGLVGGLRYINLSEQFLYRADTTDFNFNGDPTEINYRMSLNNNLFGVQIGGGLSYCVTDRLTAYLIGKFGIYDNRVTQFQTVYGTLGTATINNGPFAGQPFDVHTARNVFATAGQFDLGGRWAMTDNWSLNFGWRVLGLSGVAIAETNAVKNQFQNVAGIASGQTTGNFILHGGFLGATYCW